MVEKNEVLKLAGLAKLEFNEAELDGIIDDLSEFIEFAGTVNNYNASTKAGGSIIPLSELRDDETEPSLSREKILENAYSENGMFIVKGGI